MRTPVAVNGQIVLDPAIYITVFSLAIGSIATAIERLWNAYRNAMREVDRLNIEIRENIFPLLEGVSAVLHLMVKASVTTTDAQAALRDAVQELTGGVHAVLEARASDVPDDIDAPRTQSQSRRNPRPGRDRH